jgi:ubiquinone/menaquinone biosynthesis C-methylase UbiE
MGSPRSRSGMEGCLLSDQLFPYDGSTLEKFSHARNWKSYWVSVLRPYIAGDVLEVGAGLGANTERIKHPQVRSIHCLEPDEALAARLREAVQGTEGITVSAGTIENVHGRLFDSILYIDVLEHIEHDKTELARATQLLKPGGRLVVLSPAHRALYSPFDKAIGHYQRYDRKSLGSCAPAGMSLEMMKYLDCVGLIASGANRLILKQRIPTLRQIMVWDKYMVPASTILDRLLGYRFGKSIAAVWVRPG